MAMSGTETKARQDRIFGVPEQVSTGAVGRLQVVQFGCSLVADGTWRLLERVSNSGQGQPSNCQHWVTWR